MVIVDVERGSCYEVRPAATATAAGVAAEGDKVTIVFQAPGEPRLEWMKCSVTTERLRVKPVETRVRVERFTLKPVRLSLEPLSLPGTEFRPSPVSDNILVAIARLPREPRGGSAQGTLLPLGAAATIAAAAALLAIAARRRRSAESAPQH